MKLLRFAGCTSLLLIFARHAHEVCASTPQPPAGSQAGEVVPEVKANLNGGKQAATRTKSQIFQQKISLTMANVPLEDVLTQVAVAADVKIELDADALRKADLDLDRLYDVSITDVDLNKVIWMLFLRQKPFRAPLDLQYRNDVLFVTTQAAKVERTRQALPEWLLPCYDQNTSSITLDDDQQVISLDLSDQLTDEMLLHFPTLTKLRELKIRGTPWFTRAGASHLAKLTSLDALSLSISRDAASGKNLGDAVLQSVAGLKTLRKLDLYQCGITIDGIQHFNELGQLTSLRIYQGGLLTDSLILSIVRHKHLKSLELICNAKTGADQTSLTPEGTRRLTRLKELEYLNLAGHNYSPETFEFPRLKSLIIRGRTFDDQLATAIANCPELSSLNLEFDQVTDDAFQHLAELDSLALLRLRCPVISDVAISHLKHVPRLSSVYLWSKGLTDESLVHLSKIEMLNDLNLNWSKNRFSLDGLKQLDRLAGLKSLELRIIPEGNGARGISIAEPDRSLNITVALSSAPQRPVVSDSDRKRIPFDLDSLVDAFPRTQIILSYEHDRYDK